jgi:hypothetical protein
VRKRVSISAYLLNPYAWTCAIAWLALFYEVTVYLRCSTALANIINDRFPDLWSKLRIGSSQSPWNAYGTFRAERLDRLILFNMASGEHPSDPEFRALLNATRWAAFGCLLAFTLAVVMLGIADASVNGVSTSP